MLRLIPKIVLVAGLLLALSTDRQAFAQRVRATVDTDTLAIGARFSLAVSIVHDGSRRPVFPDDVPLPDSVTASIGDLVIIGRQQAGSRLLSTGERLDSVLYEVTTFALDTAYVTPQVGLATERDTVLAAGPPGFMPVRSVVPEDAEDILELAPLVDFPRLWWPWILLALLLAAAAIWWLRRPKTIEVAGLAGHPPVPVETPYAEATRRLTTLAAIAENAELKPYYVELSEILRTYLSRRVRVSAMEMTTGEVVSALGSRSERPIIDSGRIRDVQKLLSEADLVKFADYQPARAHSVETLSATRSTIEAVEDVLRPADQASEAEAGVMDSIPAEGGDSADSGASDGYAPQMEVNA